MSTANSKRWVTKLAAVDANLVVALDALLQESNVTRAARRVGITQSAMSQTLARLRHQFDDPILVKVGRQMEPSPFGLRIKARLHTLLNELEAIVGERPTFDEKEASGRFVIATVDYLALVLFPALARAVALRAPGIDLGIQALDQASIAPQLQQGLVHLYIGVPGQTERALQMQHLFTDSFSVVVGSENPLCAGGMTIDSYASLPHILVSPRREAESIISRELGAVGHTRRVAIEVPYFSIVPQLLKKSNLVATVPTRIASLYAEDHGVEVLAPPMPLPEIEICMAWHPTFSADPAQIWLRELVASVSQELP